MSHIVVEQVVGHWSYKPGNQVDLEVVQQQIMVQQLQQHNQHQIRVQQTYGNDGGDGGGGSPL